MLYSLHCIYFLIFAKCKTDLPLFIVVCIGFDGVEIKSRIVFNKRQVKNAGLTSDNFSGPTVRLSRHSALDFVTLLDSLH